MDMAVNHYRPHVTNRTYSDPSLPAIEFSCSPVIGSEQVSR